MFNELSKDEDSGGRPASLSRDLFGSITLEATGLLKTKEEYEKEKGEPEYKFKEFIIIKQRVYFKYFDEMI